MSDEQQHPPPLDISQGRAPEDKGPTSIRTFMREEHNKLVEAVEQRLERKLLDSNREILRAIAELKKLLT